LSRTARFVALGLVIFTLVWWALIKQTEREDKTSLVLVGRVFDPATDMPVTEFRVTSTPQGPGEICPSYDFKDQRGCFRIADLQPGPISLTVLVPGRIPWSWRCDPLAAGELHLEVDLPIAKEVHLRVVDQDGNKAPGWTSLVLRSLHGRPYPIGGPGGSSWSDHLNLEDGEADVVLPGVPLRAIVAVPGRSQPQEVDLDVCDSLTAVLAIDLRVTRMFLGCVLGAAADVRPDEVPENPSDSGWDGEAGRIWRMDRPIDLQFFSATDNVIGTVRVNPRYARRFVVTWGDPGPANEGLPTMTLPPGADIVRAEAKVEGYEPLSVHLGEKRRNTDLLVIVFRRSK
jgi:hypothetical protein